MEKDIIIQRYLFGSIFLVACIILSLYTTPEENGKMAAQALCDCERKSYMNYVKAYDLFLEEFNSYPFKTRVEAHEKLKEYEQKVQTEFDECAKIIENFRSKMERKYKKNPKKANEFQNAYEIDLNWERRHTARSDIEAKERVERFIQTIIPPTPDVE